MLSSQTRENTLCEFSLVIATIAKVSRKRGLWLVVRVIYCFTEVDCRDIFFSTKKSTSQINSKKCSCFIFNFSTALHLPGYGYQPSEDEVFLRPLPHGLH